MRKLFTFSFLLFAIMLGSFSASAQGENLTIKRTIPLGKEVFFQSIAASENGFAIAGRDYNDSVDGYSKGQVIGYDNSGNFLWKYKTSLQNLASITTVTDGYVAVGRTSEVSHGQIFKLDYNGNLVWSKNLYTGERYTSLSDVASNSTNIYTVGAASSCALVAKYDMLGNLIWKKNMPTSFLKAIAVDDNRCIVAGSEWNTDHFDASFFCFDTNGNILWENTISEFNPYDIEITQDGYITTGEGRWISDNAGGIRQIIVKFDTNGDILWRNANDSRGSDFSNAYENELGYIAFGQAGEKYINGPHNAVYCQYDKNGNLLYEKETDFINITGADKFYRDVAKTKNGYVGIGETFQITPDSVQEYIVIFEETQGIKITNATIITADGISRNLKNPRTSIGFLKQEQENEISFMSLQNEYSSSLNVSVDWGSNPQGEIILRGDISGIEVSLKDGEASVDFAGVYPAGETFTLVAQTISDKNEVKTEKLKLPIDVVSFTAKFFPETNSTVSMQNIPLFEDMVLAPGFTVEEDTGLFKKVIRNGVLTIEFSKDDDTFSFFSKKKMPAEVYGRLNIPVFDAKNGKWNGKVTVNMLPKNIFEIRKNVFFYIPWTANVGANGAVNGQYSISYQSGKWFFEGAVIPEVAIEIFGGAGIDAGNNALKVGLIGDGFMQLPLYFRTDGVAFEPNGSISAGIRGEIKCFKFVDIQGNLNLLNVTLSKNGWSGTAFDGEIQLFNLDEAAANEDFELADREYITEETGFVTNEEISLLSDVTDETIVYKNAAPYAEGTICSINDELYMFFTEDDTSRLTQNGLNLMYSRLGEDGCWSSPAAVEDDGTLDSTMTASGNFLIWEDCTKILAENEICLSDSLMNTGITAAKINENGTIELFELETGEGYHYSPDICKTANGAAAMWVTSEAADILNNNGSYDISLAAYNGESWEKKTILTDLTALGKSQLVYCENNVYVLYKINDSLYCYDNKNDTTILICEEVKQYYAAEINGKLAMAYFNTDNQLFYSADVLDKSAAYTELSPTGNSDSAANNLKMEIINNEVFIYWITHQNGQDMVKAIIKNANGGFSGEIKLLETGDTIKEVSLAACCNKMYMSYFSEENSLTADGILKTQTCNFHVTDIKQAADLAVVQESFTISNEGNQLYAAFTVENNGVVNSANYTVDILCEETTVYSESQEGLNIGVSRTSIVPINNYGQGTDTYKIRITPDGLDTNYDNNSCSTLYYGINLNIKDAYEVILSNKRTLEVVVENAGACGTEGTIVVKTQDGTIVSEKKDYFNACDEKAVTMALDKNLKSMLLEVEINCDNDRFDDDNTLLIQCGDVTGLPLSVGSVSVNDKLEVSFSASYNGGDKLNAVLYAACYDDKHRLVGIKSKTTTISNNETYFDVSLSEYSKETYEIKIFVWEPQTLKPLSKAIGIYK